MDLTKILDLSEDFAGEQAVTISQLEAGLTAAPFEIKLGGKAMDIMTDLGYCHCICLTCKLREGAGTSRSRERERDRDREWWRRRAEGERVRSSLVSIASARWPCARCGLMSRAFIIISRLYTSLYTCLQSDILCISSRCVHLYLLLQ